MSLGLGLARNRMLAAHRWLGLVLAAQLFIAGLGGFFWGTRDHKETKGLTRKQAFTPAPLPETGIIPLDGAILAAGIGDAPLERARLFRRFETPVWELRAKDKPAVWVDARTGALRGHLTESEAKAIVAAEYTGPAAPLTATFLEEDPPAEWEGRPLPVWRVAIADVYGTRAYVDPGTGETGNNWFTDAEDTWAFLFALHTMDWDGGPLEVNPLLALFATGVLVLTITGLALWAFRVAMRRGGNTAA